MGTAELRTTWIVCRGQFRRVDRGRVTCPSGRRVPLQRCLDCHLLETIDEERRPDLSCVMEQPAA